MKPRHHLPSLIALILASAAFVLSLIVAGQILTSGQVKQQAQQSLLTAAARADNTAANRQASPACNPAPNAGRLGVCAPQSGPSAALAQAAGDPFLIGGVRGVDVSSFQNCSHSFGGVIQFVITKATESTGYTDQCLRSNIAAAKQQHKVYGSYDFLRPKFGQGAADAEAAHYVSAIVGASAQKGLLVADVEANAGLSPAGVHSYVCTWVRHVRNALHPRTVVIYTGFWFWSPSVSGDNCGAVLWISAYASYALKPSAWGGGQFSYGRYEPRAPFWQYSDGIFGPTPHINGWDSDYFNGSLTQLRALVAPAGPPKPKPNRNANRRCAELAHYRDKLRRHKPVSRLMLRRARNDRAALIAHRYRCSPAGKAVHK